ncbi:MAG: M15 family metallopeptidase [Sulfurospirillaceae bacterium]|nr:M15 family metallopeptidase [Sulfurospirillaceae bacterium]MDD3462482.1 M15 family metallopeptidase [Sulfurospirillaceae bacterium]
MQRREFLGIMGASALSTTAFGSQNSHLVSSVWLRSDQKESFSSVLKKLFLIQSTVGHANFNLISYDEALKIASAYSNVGKFTKKELDFIEEIFHVNPSMYGFYGRKTCERLTDRINLKDVIKIPSTGHYLFKGVSENAYRRAISDVGNTLVLTSGVRSVVKQMSLYLSKIQSTDGNISLASRSLAPPAYSYHSLGDFDVGKKGWGYKNFTVSFTMTEEFWHLMKLPYISMRYTINNNDGVRFEPWHVKII